MYWLKKNIISILLVFAAGAAAGSDWGYYIVKELLHSRTGVYAFIFTPSKNLFDIVDMLNSNDVLKRIEGYYGYRESGLNDLEFLYNRYKIEKSEITRRVILWTAQRDADPEKLNSFYKKCYNISTETLKIYLQMKINSYELLNNDPD